MAISLPVALMALAAIQQTDTTIAVSPTARLDVANQAGAIIVRTWNRNELRVRAEHGSRDIIEIESRGSVVTLKARRRMGMPAIVDYELTVPVTMSLKLGGIHAEVDVTGVTGDISAESIEGDIIVRGAGNVNLGSVEGDITVIGARGQVRVHGVDGDIRVSDVIGDVSAETIDGDVTLHGIDGANIDASTIDGEVSYHGTIREGGRYRLTSHDGDVICAIPTNANASFTVATFDGEFEADPAFRVQVTGARPGRRFSFVLGNGSAQVELESFDGSILLRRQ
ncbi:MAG TPA: DUF4097 family beta strand repeat-containing protein [Gemmatimonadales bacterium]